MGKYHKTKDAGIFLYEGPKGAVFGIDYYACGKKHREVIGPHLTDARKKLAERRAQAKDGIAISKHHTFRELSQEFARFNSETPSYQKTQKYYLGYWVTLEDGTMRWRDMSLTKAFGDHKLFQITPHAIEGFKQKRKEAPVKGPAKRERQPVSVNRELAVLRMLLNKAIEWAWLEKNPFSVFRQSVFYGEDNSRSRFLSPDEMVRLFEALEHRMAPRYLKPAVLAGILTGLRKGDLLKLRWKDIDLQRGCFTYLEQKKRTSRSTEPKTITQYMSQDLIDLFKAIPVTGEYVFLMGSGKRVTNPSHAFKMALRRAGITNFHFHDLRHTCASYLLMRGATLPAVQKQLNHASYKTTERYSDISEQFQRDAVKKLDGLILEAQNSMNLVRTEATQNATA